MINIYKEILKAFILKLIKNVIYFSGAYFVLGHLFNNKGIYILMYHKIADRDDVYYLQDIAVKKEEFVKQLNYFTNKYTCISMSAAVELIKSKTKLDKDYVVFTFDDGYLDNLKHGEALFRQYSIKPIIYITAGKIEKKEPIWTEIVDSLVFNAKQPYFDFTINDKRIFGKLNVKKSVVKIIESIKKELIKMPQNVIRIHLENLRQLLNLAEDNSKSELLDWEGVRKLKELGCEIGSHTMNHINLGVEAEGIINKEMEESRKLIESKISGKVEFFAFPYGQTSNFTLSAVELVKKYYKSAVTTVEGINHCRQDLHLLRRIMIANHHDLIDVKIKVLKIKIVDFFKNNESHSGVGCD